MKKKKDNRQQSVSTDYRLLTTDYHFRGVALNVHNYNHLTDHLAAVAAFMDIPLMLTDHDHAEFTGAWYPVVNVILEEWDNMNPAYYAQNYDVLFQSDFFPKRLFRETFAPFQAERDRPMRNVHCPHGFSDKGFWFSQVVNEDITLIYGQNMLDLLEASGVKAALGPHIITGNYRYTYFKKHREYLLKKLQDEIISKFKGRKARRTILYAPTWSDLEKNSSFFSIAPLLLEKLAPEDNLIIKLHPKIEEEEPVAFYRMIGKYENKPNVIILDKFSPVYPILDVSDVYIGDMSSVGYDYLAFNRPMFFLNERRRDSQKDRGLFLYRCGIEVKPEDYPNIYEIIEKNLAGDGLKFGKIREDVYHYTFGNEKSFEEIRAEVMGFVNG